MTEPKQDAAAPERGTAPSSEFVRDVSEAVQVPDKARVRALLADVHGPDLADLIELLEPEDRVKLILAVGPEFDFRGVDRSRREGARPDLGSAPQ